MNDAHADVLLVQAPPWGVRFPSLGLAYLVGALRTIGVRVAVEDVNLYCYRELPAAERQQLYRGAGDANLAPEYQFEFVRRYAPDAVARFGARLLERAPRVVGFTVNAMNRPMTNGLAREVRRLRPEAVVVAGGPDVYTLQSKNELDRAHLDADYVVHGEGERSFNALVEHLLRGARPAALPGVSALAAQGNPPPPPPAPPVLKLDEVAFPEFDCFPPLAEYEPFETDEPTLPFLFSRGCIEKCAYCADYRMKGVYRVRSAANAVAELRHQYDRYGVTRFEFIDLAMNGHVRRTLEFCEALAAERAAGRAFHFFSYAIVHERVTPELTAALKRAGCEGVNYGFESGSRGVLERMRKSATPEVAAQVLRVTAQAGLPTCINLIVGYPGETEAEFQETVAFLQAQRPWIHRVNNLSVCVLMPGTDIHDFPERYGITRRHGTEWEDAAGNTPRTRRRRAAAMLAELDRLGLETVTVNLGPMDGEGADFDVPALLAAEGVTLDHRMRLRVRFAWNRLLDDLHDRVERRAPATRAELADLRARAERAERCGRETAEELARLRNTRGVRWARRLRAVLTRLKVR